jgi:hypothetical protein
MQVSRFLRWDSRSVGIAGPMLAAGLWAAAQQSFTWEKIKTRFEGSNPAMKADADNADAMKTEEIGAYLRSNPQLAVEANGRQTVNDS